MSADTIEPDLTPRSRPSISKQRRARAKVVKTKLWCASQVQSPFVAMNQPMDTSFTAGASCDTWSTSNLHHCIDGVSGSDHDLRALLDERVEQMEHKFLTALSQAVAESSLKLAQIFNERFTVLEVDLGKMKEIVNSLETTGSQNNGDRLDAVEVRMGSLEETVKSFEASVSLEPVKQVSAIESGLAAVRQQIEYLENLLGASWSQHDSNGWRTGDRIRLNGMKDAARNDKSGVVHEAPSPQSDRVAVLLDDEDMPIRVPCRCLAGLPWSWILRSLEDRIDFLGNKVFEDSGRNSCSA